MAEVLAEYFGNVLASDIHDYGRGYRVADFLDPHTAAAVSVTWPRWVIANPPFDYAAAFVTRGLEVASRGVAVLCRVAWLEGAGRHPLLYTAEHHLSWVCPFSERLAMTLGEWDPKAESATCYAWFIFDKHDVHRYARVRAIGPGTEQRLWHETDVRRFAKVVPLPLFPEEADGRADIS